jgi:hypothetical protein
MGSEQNEFVLRTSKGRMALYLVASLTMGAVGAGLTGGVIRWLGLCFFGVCSLVFAVQLLPGASYLRLRTDGFEFCSLFRKRPVIRWEEVSEFRVVPVPMASMNMVFFDRTGAIETRLIKLNRSWFGAGEGLPDSYGLKPQELAELLKCWRATHAKHPTS